MKRISGRSGSCDEPDDEIVSVVTLPEIAQELEEGWGIKSLQELANAGVDISRRFSEIGRRSSSKIESLEQLQGFVSKVLWSILCL